MERKTKRKRKGRRLRVARVSASRVYGCRVLVSPEPERRRASRTRVGLAWLSSEVHNEVHNIMREEPNDRGRIQTVPDRSDWAQNEHCRWKDSLQSSNFV